MQGHAMLKHTKLHKVKVTELTKYGSITTIQINKRNDMQIGVNFHRYRG